MQDRITVIEQIYHQPDGKSPTLNETRFDNLLETKGQPYKRIEIEAGPEWTPLIPKGCWLDKVGMIFVENEEGRHFTVNPSQEELKAINRRVLLITDHNELSGWEVPPREGFRGRHSKPESLMVRCREGVAKYTITAYPA